MNNNYTNYILNFSFKVFILTFFVSISACKGKKVYILNKHKEISTAKELEEIGGKLSFEQYSGFKLIIKDSVLKEGFCKMDIYPNDVYDEDEIEKYKYNKIISINFQGKGFQIKEFKEKYKLELKKQFSNKSFKKYSVLSKNKKVGYLLIKENDYKLVFD